MAKSFIQPGHIMTFTAPTGGVVAGTAILIGDLLVIPQATAAETVKFEGAITGVHSHAKADSQAWTEGAKVYWDATNKVFTTTASGNTLRGAAAEAVASTAGLTTGKVRLNGVAV